MDKKELVEAAIAKMNERREEARREEEERQRVVVGRNADELKRIISAHPYIADYEPEATPTGIWIRLPECYPVKVSGWGGRPDVLTFGVLSVTSLNVAPKRWVNDIAEAIELAHDAFNGN